MRRATFGIVLVAFLVAAVACQDVLPKAPIFQRITETSEPGRGVRGGVGVMDATATPTATLPLGLFIYRDYPEEYGTCRELIENSVPTAEPIWTTIATGDLGDDASNDLRLCCTTQGGCKYNVRAIGYARGHAFGGEWIMSCAEVPSSGVACDGSSGYDSLYWPATCCDALDCGLAGGTWQVPPSGISDYYEVIQGAFNQGGYEGQNTLEALIVASTSSVSLFGCSPFGYRGYEITSISFPVEGEGECNSTTSPICIVEINAMQDATPTTSAMKDYNLRGLQGANDEYVEVVCFDPMSAAGWSLTDGTSTYVYEQDNFCWPLKAIFCDEMPDCDLETGFTDSGVWRLYDPDGNQRDVRSYPVMATPGNSWAAANYLAPDGAWVEIKPHPGTFPTNTATPTPTRTPTPTPTVTPTP